MKGIVLNPAFSDAELALIKLFRTRKISESEAIEIRTLLAKHFLNITRTAADKAWTKKSYNKKSVDKLLGKWKAL